MQVFSSGDYRQIQQQLLLEAGQRMMRRMRKKLGKPLKQSSQSNSFLTFVVARS
jgi:hypothetical protein